MDRCLLMVDAGYLFAQGGKLCVGSSARSRVQLNAETFRDWFVQLASSQCDLTPLRTYWYDAARRGIPTPQQQVIAGLANVKLRLGSLNVKNQQKGVDALIYRDLMTLARERAVCEAFLLSGDEDLREGVKAAQDMGVRVALLVIAGTTGQRTYSRTLADEADEVITLDGADLSPHISGRPIPAAPAIGSVGPPTPVLIANAAQAASRAADDWFDRASDSDIAALLSARPRIPGPLDASLVVVTEQELGTSLRGQDELRREMRRAWWDRIKKRAEGAA